MTLPEIIRHASQLFNLNDPVDKEIAGDWIEQQEGIDETVISLTAAAIRTNVWCNDIITETGNYYGDGLSPGYGSGNRYGHGYGSEYGGGNGHGNDIGHGYGSDYGGGGGDGNGYSDQYGGGDGRGRGVGGHYED